MSNRFVAAAAAAAFATYVAAGLTLATVSSAFAGEVVATSAVDGPRGPVGLGAAAAAATQSPGTIGAMHYATGGLATSGADVLRQSRGLPTAVYANWSAPAQPGS